MFYHFQAGRKIFANSATTFEMLFRNGYQSCKITVGGGDKTHSSNSERICGNDKHQFGVFPKVV